MWWGDFGEELKRERGKWEREKLCWRKYLGKTGVKIWRASEQRQYQIFFKLMWLYTVNGSHKVTLFTIMPLKTGIEFLETPYFCFQFPSSSLKFLSFEWWKHHSKNKPNKIFSVEPTSFGLWVMETEWYHSALWVSKQKRTWKKNDNRFLGPTWQQYQF